MKPWIRLAALALLLSVCILAGCQPSADTESSSAAESLPAESIGAESSSETVSDPEPPPEEPDFFTKHGQSTLPDSAALPAVCEPTETAHLYTLPLSLPDADGFSVQVNGDILQLSYMQEGPMCRFYSLITGELLCELTLPPRHTTGPLEGGGLWCVDYSVCEVSLYSANGNREVLSFEGTDGEDGLPPYDVSVSPDGRYLLAIYSVGDPIVLFDLQQNTKTPVHTVGNTAFRWIFAADNGFYLPASDNSIVFVDTASRSAEKFYHGREASRFYGGLFSFLSEDRLILSGADSASERFYMEQEEDETLSALSFGCAATVPYYQSNLVRFYDLRAGQKLSEVLLSEDGIGIHAAFLQSGAVLLFQHTNEAPLVFLYDLPAAAEKDGEAKETYLFTDEALREETDRLANRIEQETGIDLLYGTEGNDFLLSDYVGAMEADPYVIYRSVQTVSGILACYPEGMLREAYMDTHRGLQIYLCGTLYGTGADSLSRAGGLTTDSNGYILVALDVRNDLRYDLPHELSHVFDRRISYVGLQSGTDWLSVWEAATPFLDAYTYTYLNYHENSRYTAWYETDENEVWFVDSYARTHPTEDRARIMEHLFHPEDGLAEVLQYEHLQEKARLYCYILRQCFESCSTAEPLYWESHLGKIDESVLPA